MRSRTNIKITAVFALMATVAGAQARDQVELPWRLADYPTGGRTMAGMVAALSGVAMSAFLENKARREREFITDELIIEHG